MLSKEQREARRSAIGGSDWASVLSIEPYGCARKLWYDKQGQEPDYEKADDPVLERGSVLEPIVIDRYSRKTGRLVFTDDAIPNKQIVIAPWWRVNADGIIPKGYLPEGDPMYGKGDGYLEAKTMNREIFYKCVREGLSEGYIMQNQAGMAAYDLQWGSFAIMWPDGWKTIHFDIERDDDLISLMKTAGAAFWRSVENGPTPDRLDIKDKRCSKCEFRHTCQGTKLLEALPAEDGDIPYDAGLSPLMSKLVELEEIKDEIDDLVSQQKQKIQNAMADRPVVDTVGFRLHNKPARRNQFNTKKFRQDHPKLADEYTYVNVTKPAFRKYPK